ncbi:MAG: hypothetical protein V4660_11450 [Pseudomonadota bacterium]
MHKKTGFTRFEFYIVMIVIGLVVLVGIQRYFQLTEQVQRFSFEALARHFNAAVYNARSQWFIRHQENLNNNIVDLSGIKIQMSEQGWPLSVAGELPISETNPAQTASLLSCIQLWQNLLQNPQPISYAGGDDFGSRPYHLVLTQAGECRYQLFVKNSNQYYFDYSPKTGQVRIHTPVTEK